MLGPHWKRIDTPWPSGSGDWTVASHCGVAFVVIVPEEVEWMVVGKSYFLALKPALDNACCTPGATSVIVTMLRPQQTLRGDLDLVDVLRTWFIRFLIVGLVVGLVVGLTLFTGFPLQHTELTCGTLHLIPAGTNRAPVL
jgi:hypothetical protein